jgi:hypothetical protein
MKVYKIQYQISYSNKEEVILKLKFKNIKEAYQYVLNNDRYAIRIRIFLEE